MIQVAKTLDHETTSEYILTIIAHDRSSAPLSSSTFVTINVTDVNDNQPEFVQNPYKLTLKEDVPINEVILHVSQEYLKHWFYIVLKLGFSVKHS